MNLFDELRELGVDVDDGLERVLDDQPLYEMMLGMFIDTVNSNPIEAADFDSGSLDVLIERVHILKGLTGNLSLTPLFTGYVQMLDLLRTGRSKEAGMEYERLIPIQQSIMECINRHMSAQA